MRNFPLVKKNLQTIIDNIGRTGRGEDIMEKREGRGEKGSRQGREKGEEEWERGEGRRVAGKGERRVKKNGRG